MTNPYQPAPSPDPWGPDPQANPYQPAPDPWGLDPQVNPNPSPYQAFGQQTPSYQQPPAGGTQPGGSYPSSPASQSWTQPSPAPASPHGYNTQIPPQNLPYGDPAQAAPAPTFPPTQPYAQPTSAMVPVVGPQAYSTGPATPVRFGSGQRKEPWLSLLVSFFVPGVGSIINGDTRRGLGILAGYVTCAALSWLLLPIAGMLAFFVWGLVDAYQGAEKWNRTHGL